MHQPTTPCASATATATAIPRSMTWCRPPGASSRGWPGIGGPPSVRGGFYPNPCYSTSSTTSHIIRLNQYLGDVTYALPL